MIEVNRLAYGRALRNIVRQLDLDKENKESLMAFSWQVFFEAQNEQCEIDEEQDN